MEIVLSILITIIGLSWAIVILHKFAPKIRLSISYHCPNLQLGSIILKIAVENISIVNINKNSLLLQKLEYQVKDLNSLSEWVPFKKKDIIEGEEPITWIEPIEICKKTKHFLPGEKTVVERLIMLPPDGHIYHVGLQIKVSLEGWRNKIGGLFGHRSMQRTTTIFVIKPEDAGESP